MYILSGQGGLEKAETTGKNGEIILNSAENIGSNGLSCIALFD
jgi:hypothetical protein